MKEYLYNTRFQRMRKQNDKKLLAHNELKAGMEVEVLSGFWFEWKYYKIKKDRLNFFIEKAKHKQVRLF